MYIYYTYYTLFYYTAELPDYAKVEFNPDFQSFPLLNMVRIGILTPEHKKSGIGAHTEQRDCRTYQHQQCCLPLWWNIPTYFEMHFHDRLASQGQNQFSWLFSVHIPPALKRFQNLTTHSWEVYPFRWEDIKLQIWKFFCIAKIKSTENEKFQLSQSSV